MFRGSCAFDLALRFAEGPGGIEREVGVVAGVAVGAQEARLELGGGVCFG